MESKGLRGTLQAKALPTGWGAQAFRGQEG